MTVMYYTDGEAALIYLTAALKYDLAAASSDLHKELADCPWLKSVTDRHSEGSVAMRWMDFRTAINSDLKPTRGAKLPQIRRVVESFEWLTSLTIRDDLVTMEEAAA
jgi:hypothetical protein